MILLYELSVSFNEELQGGRGVGIFAVIGSVNVYKASFGVLDRAPVLWNIVGKFKKHRQEVVQKVQLLLREVASLKCKFDLSAW